MPCHDSFIRPRDDDGNWTRNKTVLDAGPLEVKTQKHEGFVVPPIVAVGSLVVGVALVLIPRRRRV